MYIQAQLINSKVIKFFYKLDEIIYKIGKAIL